LTHESYGARKILVDCVQNQIPAGSEKAVAEDIKKRVERTAALKLDYTNLVHLPKTLDGSYYMGLTESDMGSRDDDQCVSKDWVK